MKSFGGVGKKLNILVYDFGLALEHALRLARDGHNVTYFTPWARGFPRFEDYAPGLGYEDVGLKKTLYFFEEIPKNDLIVFFDVGAGDLCQFLRQNLDIPVYGAGEGEKLENHRILMRRLQKKIGLPTQYTVEIKGIPMLRKYLERNPNKFVKLDIFRGDVESFYAKTYDDVELYLDEIEVALGPFNEIYEFMVEDFIEGIEPGFDLFFNGKDWVKPYLWGVEQNKSCYVGKYVDTLPEPLQLIADKLKPILQKIDYRGALSTEVRVDKNKTPYLIDVCARLPFPLSAVYTESIRNYSEVIYKVAKSEDVKLDVAGKYVVAVPLSTKHADTHWVKLIFDEKYKKFIKTRISAKVDGNYYAVKGMDTVFVLVAVGDDYHKLIKIMEALVEKVDAFGLNTDTISGLYKIDEVLQKYDKYGMGKF